MSTRYVWEKFNVGYTEKSVSGTQHSSTSPVPTSTRYIHIVYGSSYKIVNGRFQIVGGTSLTISTAGFKFDGSADDFVRTDVYPYFIASAYTTSGTGKHYPNMTSSPTAMSTTATSEVLFVDGYVALEWGTDDSDLSKIVGGAAGSHSESRTVTASKGSTSYGYASSADSSEYPKGVSGSYWYEYLGSDCIDPISLDYSSDSVTVGDAITMEATPCSNTYGGVITYMFQYLSNGTWSTAGVTSGTSVSVTIPNTPQFRGRVLASDGWGFTSTTYVYGSMLSVSGVSGGGGGSPDDDEEEEEEDDTPVATVYPVRIAIEGTIKNGLVSTCVDGAIKSKCSVYTSVDGTIKQCS